MYNINYENLQKGISKWIGAIFLVVIIAIIIVFFTFAGSIKSKEYDSKTEAIFLHENCTYQTTGEGKREEVCFPDYNYQVGDQMYNCRTKISISPPIIHEGHYIYYDSNNPSRCMTDDSASIDIMGIAAIIFIFGLIIFYISKIIEINRKIKTIKKLQTTGTLIKNLPYQFVDTKYKFGQITLKAPALSYTTPNGQNLYLVGEPIYDKNATYENTIDLLIDLNNTNDYYIDFNIGNNIQNMQEQNNQN